MSARFQIYDSSCSPLLFLSLQPSQFTLDQHQNHRQASGCQHHVLNHSSQKLSLPPSVKIQSLEIHDLHPTQPPRSPQLPVELNFTTALHSISPSSLYSTANISDQDFPVFTTDTQSTWLPNTVNPPESTVHNQSPVEPQQDFVLFDSPQPRQTPNRSALLNSQRRHSYHNRRENPVSTAAQNQRVAQILQAIGHQSSSTVNANRFASQFYASSAPSSTVSLNQKSRSSRPPVPLFYQDNGSNQHTAKMMNAADVDLDEFPGFEGGATTAFSSPAVPSSYDFNGSMSSSTSNLGTVSPQDLLVQDTFMSAPNSAALTALTSPSIYNDSPELGDGFDVSPNFGHADFDSADPWYPLFPQENNTAPGRSSLDDSPSQKSDDFDLSDRTPSSRKKSGTSPTSGRHSSVSGVNARKRDKPLPPIIIDDPADTVAMKRARNTLAARKSRERKAQKLDELEDKIAKLEAERDHWKQIALSRS